MPATFATLQNLFEWRTVRASGGDDSSDLQDAIDAVAANGGGAIFLPDAEYELSNSPTTVNGSTAQIHFPAIGISADGGIGVTLIGRGQQSFCPSVVGTIIVPTGQTVIASTATSGAVFGGRFSSGGPVDWTLVNAGFQNLTIRTQDNPALTGLDLSWVACCDLRNVIIDTGVYNIDDVTQPTTSTAYGIKLPAINNGANVRLDSVMVIGYYTGFKLGEHTHGDNLSAWGCNYAMEIANENHGMYISRFLDTHCRNGIRVTASSTPHPRMTIGQFAVEWVNPSSGSPTWQRRQADIVDGSNLLYGSCGFAGVEAGVGPSATILKTGGSNFVMTAV